MQELNRIPRVLQTLEELKATHKGQDIFDSYKVQVRLFIETMQKEMVSLIQKYEKTIVNLRKEISRLKEGRGKDVDMNQFVRTPVSSRYVGKNFNSYSGNKHFDNMPTAVSNVFTPYKMAKMQSLPISKIMKKVSLEESQFPEELLGNQQQSMFQHNQSKFQINSKRRKQKQQQLRLFLESGNKSLNVTTNQFLDVIGKNQKKTVENVEEFIDERSHERKEESLNKSLGQICEALDTSFVSKRARSEKKKKESKAEEQKRRKQKLQEDTDKMIKDRGIKSFLQRLRHNVEASPNQKPEPIAVSRLIQGEQKSKIQDEIQSPSKKSSKVLINPVPVIGRKASTSRQSSPERKPQSILKRSSTMLSKSITGFSANQFSL